ncbi:MAG: FKBP-type peptidyl-prolyl cis-trans isomerase [Bacteroidales bacterium]|nr:FKBP-type peptidyl-prolyl cis-trans isomerase [Bacteroidales bacterium]
MKKLTLSILALASAAVMFSCGNSLEKSETGLKYQFFEQNPDGKAFEESLIAEVKFGCKINDTMVIIPEINDYLPCIAPLFDGDVFEGLAMMHAGDSAAFITDTKNTFDNFFRSPLPENVSETDVLRFDIRVVDFITEEEFDARMIERLKEFYPEETEKAANELSEYLKTNNINVAPTASGLYVDIHEEGNGETPSKGDIVKVHYTGKLLNDTIFDSSIERGEPIEIPIGVGAVIKGWDEGIMMLSKGSKATLYIPYYLGYMDRPAGMITPFSNLVFDVELIDFHSEESEIEGMEIEDLEEAQHD